jgi:DNA polymerase I-like protein with 3'-5' exonuclease and polymerase domains
MDFSEAKPLVDYLTISKRLGQLAEGKEAWLRCVENGRIHGRINTNGTVSGRCSHSRPNVSQVPSVSSPYGSECRALFLPDDGHVLVGVDASGLELRMLAHYLAYFDGGAYAKQVCEGDIHTTNMEAAGLENRNQAKRFIYAWLYGGGDNLIGEIIDGGAREGKQIKKRFMDRLPAFKKLKKHIEKTVDAKGHLHGLDGRVLPVRSKHSALNLLLQSAGAVVMKEATKQLLQKPLHVDLREIHQVAHIHDEIQLSVHPSVAEETGKIAVESIRAAGETLNLKVPLTGEYKIGANWSETH